MRRSGLRAARGRFLVADPAPLWQRPLVALSGLFLKSPVQVRQGVWRAQPYADACAPWRALQSGPHRAMK